MTHRTKSTIRYLLAYLVIEIGFLFWRLCQQMLIGKAALFMAGATLAIVTGLAEYHLLFVPKTHSERRDLLINLTLLSFSLIIMFFSFCYGYALILNRRGYYDRHQLFFEYFQPDAELGYKAKPNLVNMNLAWSLGNISPVPHSTDEFGFRADGSKYGVPIAVVGDSFGFGAWMPTENSWPEKLEDALNIPVTNYSASGYSLWQYNHLIAANVRRFQNKLVIYSIFANDLKNDLAEEANKNDYYRYAKWDKFKDPITYTVTDLGLTIDSPLSLVFNAIHQKIEDLNSIRSAHINNGLVLFLGYTGLTPEYFKDGSEQVVFDKLEAAKEISSRNGAQLVIIIFPSKESVYKDEFIKMFSREGTNYVQSEENAYKRVCNFSQEQDIPCYNLTEDLRRYATISPPLYFAIDSHLNEAGNTAVAQLIAGYFMARSLTTNVVH